MRMSAEDRVALILGRTIIRAESLQAQNELLRAKVRELEEATEEVEDGPSGVGKTGETWDRSG